MKARAPSQVERLAGQHGTEDPGRVEIYWQTMQSTIIRFPDESSSLANKYVQSLADDLADIQDLQACPARERPETQDFGATLVLVLGTASATAVANGIRKWLTRTGTSAEFRTPDGKVKLTNVESKDIAEIARALVKQE